MTPENKALLDAYPQYYKDVSHLEVIDVYRIIDLYGVTDPTAQHSLKKLLLSGKRTGGKTVEKDLKEARDTLSRGLEMHKEDLRKGLFSTVEAAKLLAPVSYTPADVPADYASVPFSAAPFQVPTPPVRSAPRDASIKFCKAGGCNNRTTDNTTQTCFHHSAPTPPGQVPRPPKAFHCVEIGCTLPAAPSAIRCTKHCAPAPKMTDADRAEFEAQPSQMPVAEKPAPFRHAPWCEEKCAASACVCVGWESNVPPAPTPIEPQTMFPQLPVAEVPPLPYDAPTASNPVPRGPVAAPQGPKL